MLGIFFLHGSHIQGTFLGPMSFIINQEMIEIATKTEYDNHFKADRPLLEEVYIQVSGPDIIK